MHSAGLKLVREVECICIALSVPSHDLHRAYIFWNELPGPPLGHRQVLCGQVHQVPNLEFGRDAFSLICVVRLADSALDYGVVRCAVRSE